MISIHYKYDGCQSGILISYYCTTWTFIIHAFFRSLLHHRWSTMDNYVQITCKESIGNILFNWNVNNSCPSNKTRRKSGQWSVIQTSTTYPNNSYRIKYLPFIMWHNVLKKVWSGNKLTVANAMQEIRHENVHVLAQ